MDMFFVVRVVVIMLIFPTALSLRILEFQGFIWFLIVEMFLIMIIILKIPTELALRTPTTTTALIWSTRLVGDYGNHVDRSYGKKRISPSTNYDAYTYYVRTSGDVYEYVSSVYNNSYGLSSISLSPNFPILLFSKIT